MEDKELVCPHCSGTHLNTAQLPTEVIAVVPCPACQELCVLFRGKVLAVDKRLLRTGTRRQRILHIAELITEFVDSGVIPEANSILNGEGAESFAANDQEVGKAPSQDRCAGGAPISDEEYLLFQQVELRAIDNAAFFRRTFG